MWGAPALVTILVTISEFQGRRTKNSLMISRLGEVAEWLKAAVC